MSEEILSFRTFQTSNEKAYEKEKKLNILAMHDGSIGLHSMYKG